MMSRVAFRFRTHREPNDHMLTDATEVGPPSDIKAGPAESLRTKQASMNFLDLDVRVKSVRYKNQRVRIFR